MLPPPPFSPLSPSEGSPLSSPVSTNTRRSFSSRRSLSSRIGHVSSGDGDSKNRSHSPAVYAIILILAILLVSIQWMNVDYDCPGCNEMSTLLLESHNGQFEGNALRRRSLTVPGSSESRASTAAAVKELKDEHDQTVSALQERISQLEHQVENLQVQTSDPDVSSSSKSPPADSPSDIMATASELQKNIALQLGMIELEWDSSYF